MLSMIAILLLVTPFKIVHYVVGWILVNVVYLGQRIRIGDECNTDQAVNREVPTFATLRQYHSLVAIVCCFLFQNPIWPALNEFVMTTPIMSVSNSTEVGNLIEASVTRDRFPYFICGYHVVIHYS